jgi:hypothetical protein
MTKMYHRKWFRLWQDRYAFMIIIAFYVWIGTLAFKACKGG